MEMNCRIIQDLLPLYTEGMLSADSVTAVEQHITGCEECRCVLEELKRPAQIKEIPTKSFQRINAHIRHRRWMAVLFGICLTAALLLGVFTWLYQPTYLSADEAIAGVTEQDGMIAVEFMPEADHFRAVEDAENSITLIACSRRWDLLSHGMKKIAGIDAQQIGRVLFLKSGSEVWYAAIRDTEGDTLLWGKGFDGGRVSLPWNGMMFYLLLGVFGAIILGLLWCFFRKKKIGAYLSGGTILCVSGVFSVWFSTGGSMLIYDPTDKPVLFIISAILAVLITGSVLLGKRLYDIVKNQEG